MLVSRTIPQPTRRSLMKVIILTACTLLLPRSLPAQNTSDADLVRTTVTYKVVDEHEILADVYRIPGDSPVPIIVWIHGGALINGHRGSTPPQLRQFCQSTNCALISIDYRLAPESKLPSIIEDVEDFFTWLHETGATEHSLDRDRVAVMGGSAGGYLTLVCGHRVEPKPDALIAFWGYGELVSEWLSEPSPHRRHNSNEVTRESALEQIDGTVVSDSRERNGNGGLFYLYCRQTGSWTREVSGFDPSDELERLVPYMPLYNVSNEYPPTILFHGTADTDVPHDQSLKMAEAFKTHEVSHQLISIEGAEHGLGGGDPEEIEQGFERVWQFLREQLDLPSN